MQKVQDQVWLYSHQIGGGQDSAPLEAAMPRMMQLLQTEFGAVIADLPRASVLGSFGIVQRLDALVVAIPAGFSGVNAASRLIAQIRDQAPDLRILPVISELRRDAGLGKKDIAAALSMEITAILPRCDKSMAKAQRAAVPVLKSEPRGAYAKAVGTIWQAARARPEPAKRGGFLRKFFK